MMLSWQRRRSAFNHDWLARMYIGRIDSFIKILDGRGSAPNVEAEFLQEILPKWEQRRGEAFQLPVDFLKEMSPKSLFEQEPLCHCDADTKAWIPELVDRLWRAQYPVEEWVEEARKAAAAVDACYQEVREALDKLPDRSRESLRRLRPGLEELHERCKALSEAISALPHEVLVV